MSDYVQLEIPFSFEEEEFRDIENYEGLYMISNFGQVFSIKRNKILSPTKNNKGYFLIQLWKDGKMKHYLVHRLVASAFLENPLHLPMINHKDENKENNFVSNLEWCDAKYNANYGTARERAIPKILKHPNYKANIERLAKKRSKQVLQFTKNGEFVKEYPSTMEAERHTKIDNSHISQCCLGKLKSAGGYVWCYKDVS